MTTCWPLQMPPTQKSVLMALAHQADDSGVCEPTVTTLRILTCFERTALIEAVKWLEQHGILRGERSPGRPTRFTLDPRQYRPPSEFDDAEQPAAPVRQTDGSPSARRRPSPGPACPIQRIVEVYHEALPNAPRCMRLTATRETLIRSRWREFAAEKDWSDQAVGLEFFRRFFEHCGQSKFLTGRVEQRDGRPPFVADLEWLMRPSNFAKCVEGHYHRGQ